MFPSKRPVFAAVISLLLIVFGLVSFGRLPLREYPDIDPPVVTIETLYPGASANVVETRITELIEERIAGVEGIRFIASTSEDGAFTVTVEFDTGRDVDGAVNDVRDRVSAILDDLPDEADPPEIQKGRFQQRCDHVVESGQRSFDRPGLDRLCRSLSGGSVFGFGRCRAGKNWRRSKLRHADLDRPQGHGGAGACGQRRRNPLCGKKIWSCRPEASSLKSAALRCGSSGPFERRRTSAAWSWPAATTATWFAWVTSPASSAAPKRTGHFFGAMAWPWWEWDHQAIHRQYHRCGPRRQSGNAAPQSHPARGDGNQAELRHIRICRRRHQGGLQDLLIAIGLVTLVIYLFLGSVRATIIPAVTVPVSIIASFIVLNGLGFSVNLLTLLALVLAIGLVVDDAIVVLENIYRRMAEKGESPLVAAYRGTRQVGFAVIATSLVLVAVFVPIAFLQGDVGRCFPNLPSPWRRRSAFPALWPSASLPCWHPKS
jgi:multidrug efflux pump